MSRGEGDSLKPGKLFYKIGEVSRITGLEPYVLRYWETEFPMLRPKKNSGGQRVYLRKDIDLVLKIKQMLHHEGYTILGARKKLQESGPKKTRLPMPEILTKVKTELREILQDIQQTGRR